MLPSVQYQTVCIQHTCMTLVYIPTINITNIYSMQIGTPFYMSPELFKSKPYSYKSDVWSLGCCLYEMLSSGQHAFDAQSINGLAFKVLKGNFQPLTAKHLTKDIKDLVKAMLATNPNHRPSLREILHMPFIRKRIKTVVKVRVYNLY